MKTLIFDFDGTIADSLPFFIKKMGTIAGRQMPSQEEIRGMALKDLLRIHKVKAREIPLIAYKMYGEFKAHVRSIPPVSGFKSVVRDLYQQGYDLHIVTSNSEENVRAFLNAHDLEFFTSIKGYPALFGKGSIIRKLIKGLGADNSQCVYIGDETRDIEAARNAGVKSVAVTWGYNTEAVLGAASPDFIAREPLDLMTIFPARLPAREAG